MVLFEEDIIRFILKFIGEIQVIQGGYIPLEWLVDNHRDSILFW